MCQFPLTSTNYQTQDSARQENVDQQGNIQGQYSYVDPNGKTITVKYTAGKDGFQVQGDHLPTAPQGLPTASQGVQGLPQSYQHYQPSSQGLGLPQSFQSYNQQPYQQSFQSPFQTQGLGQYGNQAQGLGQFGNQFSAPSKPLFTPASAPFPAATAGQFDNYRKALEEEREEAQKEALGQFNQGQSNLGLGQDHRFGAPLGAPQGIPQNPYNLQYGADNGFSFEYNL